MSRGKKLVTSICLVVMAVLFTACGSGKENDADGKTMVKWASWDIKNNSVENDLVKAFEKENPDIKVDITSISSSDYQDKITTMLASGDTTDVITIKNAKQYAALANSNALVDLTDHVKSDVDTSVSQDEYDIFAIDGKKTYAQPIKSDVWYLFYNRDLFDKAGLDYPEKLTWEEYVSLAGKLTGENDQGEKVYGTYQVVWPSVVQAVAYAQSDADYTNTKDFSWLKEYYDVAVELQDKGYAVDFATNSAGNESSSHSAAFEGGTAGMLLMGTWYVQDLVANVQSGDTSVNWGIAEVPQKSTSSEPTTAAAVTGVAINSKSKNQEAAQKFVDFLSSEEAAEVYASKGVFPAISNEKITEKLLDIDGMATDELTTQTLNEEKKVISELPVADNITEINLVLEENHSLIMNGEKSVDEGIKLMEKRATESVE